jgi:hypothetical protein
MRRRAFREEVVGDGNVVARVDADDGGLEGEERVGGDIEDALCGIGAWEGGAKDGLAWGAGYDDAFSARRGDGGDVDAACFLNGPEEVVVVRVRAVGDSRGNGNGAVVLEELEEGLVEGDGFGFDWRDGDPYLSGLEVWVVGMGDGNEGFCGRVVGALVFSGNIGGVAFGQGAVGFQEFDDAGVGVWVDLPEESVFIV